MPQSNLPKALIVDLDGTLVRTDDRMHFINGEKKDWDGFNLAAIDSEPFTHILQMCQFYYHYHSVDLVFITGRESIHFYDTAKWLSDHHLPTTHIHMRMKGDKRSDTIIKREKYEQYVKGKFDVLFVLEDRSSVVKMWRELGLNCLQVKEGDY